MDPTLQAPGAMGAQASPDMAMQNALKNAALLQAIKGGASGGAAPPMGQTQAATGMQQMPAMANPAGMSGAAPMGGMPPSPQMASPSPPVNPASMPGGMGSASMPPGMTPPMGTQMPMMQSMGGQPAMQGTDPVTSALFSPIPGAQ